MLTTLALSTLVLASPRPAPTPQEAPKIAANALRIDLGILRDALTTIHPGLYRYQTPAEFDAGLKQLERKFAKGATQAEVFLAVSEFTARIRCGHTFPSFWNNPIQTQRNLFTAKDKLPLAFRWLAGEMVVTRNDSSAPELTPGTSITEVNGVPTKAILAKLLKLVKGDGSNDAKRIAELELQDLKDWEAFDIYYALAFRPTSTYRLVFERMDGTRGTAEVGAIDYAERRRLRQANTPAVPKDGPEWRWEFPRADTAVLKMPTWALYNSKWDWKAWLKEGFLQLKAQGVRKLVLDVRGNAGGNECGDEIMRYLVKNPVSYPSGTTFIRYQKLPAQLAMYVSTWDRAFYDWTKSSKPAKYVPTLYSDAFQIRGEDSVNAERGGTIFPMAPGFEGGVYVLVDAECSSATFQFAQQVRNYRVGKLVGQPTGGNQKGINGGAIFFTTLPNSQIEIDIPIIAYLPSADKEDAGLSPDVTVRDTREDIAKGRDSVLEWVLRDGGARG